MPLTVRYEWRGNLVFPLFRERARAALRELAPRVEEHAKGLTPIDTGALRSTVTAFVMPEGVRLVIEAGGPSPGFGTYVAYAHLVHDGTDTMPARPFIQWALDAWAPQVKSAVARAWNPFA